MSRLGSWFRGAAPKLSANSSAAASEVDLRTQTIALLQDAMAGADLIMNDDIDGAEVSLKHGSSTFHSFGMGVCTFMRSILGFEKTIMAEAATRLSGAETSAWNDIKKAEKDASKSSDTTERIYPPGSEYSLVLAEVYLMSAIVGVLHESLTEAIKGFYKMRKAFLALDAIIQAEEAYLKKRGLKTGPPKEATTMSPAEKMPGGFDDDADLEFVDADEAHSGKQTPLTYEGHLTTAEEEAQAEAKLRELSLGSKEGPESSIPTQEAPNRAGFQGGPGSDIFVDPLDVFIHSGATMCYGVLLLVISLVPPAFSRLLSIIGFKGDRERGIKMLWQSSQFDNINGAVAGLMLCAYYNGLLGFADILPSDADVNKGAVVGYPKEKLSALLVKLRGRYPDSGLWRLEEARSRANMRDLTGAVHILKNNNSKMKQVAAINNFELALDVTYIQDWSCARDTYLRCIELNEWSPALYYYMAGSAELENYRNAFYANPRNESQIKQHKKKAEELFRKVPTVAGRKKFMARPLPFEQFVCRKLEKWEDRVKTLGVQLVDAVGISPAQEMVYLWNGIKKMSPAELEAADRDLAWERLTCSEGARDKIKAEADENALQDLLHAGILRNMEKFDEAKDILKELMAIDRTLLKGPTKDDYVLPAAHYDMAVISWLEGQKESKGGAKKQVEDILACQGWLDKVSRWEAYVLDARIGMRVATGQDTLRWYKREHGITS
ncbi:breast cancer protein [Xylariaceae sp. FL1019]|nr:breast cancer protein [Xylariaceae sp. FL1019]